MLALQGDKARSRLTVNWLLGPALSGFLFGHLHADHGISKVNILSQVLMAVCLISLMAPDQELFR